MKKIASFLILFTFFLSACQFGGQSSLPNQEASTGEAFLPQETIILFKFTTEDLAQHNKWSHLKTEVLNNSQEDFVESINTGLDFYNIDYEKDLKPIVGDQSESLLGISGSLELLVPEIYFVQKIKDINAYNSLVTTLLEAKHLIANEIGYKIKTSNQIDLFFAEKNGFLLLSNQKENLDKMLNQAIDQSLIYSNNYRDVRENLPSNFLGLLYVNIEKIASEIELKLNPIQSGSGISATQSSNSFINYIKNAGVSLEAETNGFKFFSYSEKNFEKLKTLELKNVDYVNNAPYLDKYLPGQNIYFYLEQFNLASLIEGFEKKLEYNNQNAYSRYQTQKKLFKETIGLDFDQDILTWLDQGAAISLQSSESFLPHLTIAVDVGSNKEGATKLLQTLDGFLGILMLSLQEYSEVIDKTDIEIGGSSFYHLRILKENLPLEVLERADLVVSLLSNLNVFYGITEDNLLIITTYPQLEEEYNKVVVAEDLTYKSLQKEIDPNGQTYFFIKPDDMMQDFVEFIDALGAMRPLSSQEQISLEILEKSLSAFDGSVLSKSNHKNSQKAEGYILLK